MKVAFRNCVFRCCRCGKSAFQGVAIHFEDDGARHPHCLECLGSTLTLLMGAMWFYADAENWRSQIVGTEMVSRMDGDNGETARGALHLTELPQAPPRARPPATKIVVDERLKVVDAGGFSFLQGECSIMRTYTPMLPNRCDGSKEEG